MLLTLVAALIYLSWTWDRPRRWHLPSWSGDRPVRPADRSGSRSPCRHRVHRGRTDHLLGPPQRERYPRPVLSSSHALGRSVHRAWAHLLRRQRRLLCRSPQAR